MTPLPARRAIARQVFALAFSAAVALGCTWPLVTRLGTHYPVWDAKVTAPAADQLFTSWILATDARQLVHDPWHLFESNNFHPLRRTLTFSENLLGLAVLVLPVQYVWDNPALTDNVALLLALTIGGWGVFLLVRELSGSGLAGALAGVLAIYSPAHWVIFSQLHVIAFHWVPVALFALARVVRTGRWRWSVLLGVLVALEAWTSLHHGLFLALALAVGVPVLLLLSAKARRVLPQIAAAGTLALALCIPLALPYRAMGREMDLRHRGAVFFVFPSQVAPPLRHPIHYLATRLASGDRVQTLGTLTPLLLIAAGGLAALIRRRRPPMDRAMLLALFAGGFVNCLLAFGPVSLYQLPNVYSLVTRIPGFGIVRAPLRATTYSYVILCVLAGCGLGALLGRLKSRAGRAGVAVLVLGLAVIEAGWGPMPLAPAPPRPSSVAAALADLEPGCGYAQLPADFESGAVALWQSTAHWRPLINGYSGFYGIEPFVSFWFLNQFPSPDSLAYLRAAGGCAVVIHQWPDRVVQVTEDSRALGFPVRSAGSDVVIRLPPPPPPPAAGVPLPRDAWRVVAPTAGDRRPLDGDLETLWEGSATGDETGPDRLTVDMGGPARISALDLDLGHHLRRYLVTYRVEGSPDGTEWLTLAESGVAVPPLASYRADRTRVRQHIELTPATVRYVRIGPFRRPPRNLAIDVGFETWGVAELWAYGPPA